MLDSTITFSSKAERDRWIESYHPRRECSDNPGLFKLPDGRMLGVSQNQVTLYPAPKLFACPHCGNTEGFREKNTVIVDHDFARFASHEQGGKTQAYPDSDTYGYSDICWESAEAVHDQETYRCDKCDKCFAYPVEVEHKAVSQPWPRLTKLQREMNG